MYPKIAPFAGYERAVPKLTKSAGQTDKKLKEQTDKFEALFIKQMLDQAMKAKSGLMPKGVGSSLYTSMYTQTLSDHMAGKVGFSEMLYNYLKNQE